MTFEPRTVKNTKSAHGPRITSTPVSSMPQSHLPAAPNPPPLFPPTLPTNPSATSQFHIPSYPGSATPTHFAAPPAMAHPQPGLPAIPRSQPGYPNLVPTAPVPTEMTRSSAAPPSSVVPMGLWSHSASPHGGSLDGAFFMTPPIPAITTPSAAVQHQAPLASGPLQMDAGFASEEDDDDILTPFSPVVQPVSLQQAPSTSQASQQLRVHHTAPPESSPDTNSNTSSRQSSEVRVCFKAQLLQLPSCDNFTALAS